MVYVQYFVPTPTPTPTPTPGTALVVTTIKYSYKSIDLFRGKIISIFFLSWFASNISDFLYTSFSCWQCYKKSMLRYPLVVGLISYPNRYEYHRPIWRFVLCVVISGQKTKRLWSTSSNEINSYVPLIDDQLYHIYC